MSVEEFFQVERATYIYGGEVVLNLALAFLLGMIVSWVYKNPQRTKLFAILHVNHGIRNSYCGYGDNGHWK